MPEHDTDQTKRNNSTTTTIVTMWFDLSTYPDRGSMTRPLSFYQDRAKHVLELPYDMVVFCDATTEPLARAMRDSTDTKKNKTEYVVKPLHDYEYYRLAYPIIVANRALSGPPYDARNTPSYLLMGMFKPVALQHVALMSSGTITTGHMAWLDIGCAHVVSTSLSLSCIDAMLQRPKPGVGACYIHYRSSAELADPRLYLHRQGPCGMASTAYTVALDTVAAYYSAMMAIFHEHLVLGVGHTDESVMTYCYDRYPHLFSLHFGDYASVLCNYHQAVENRDTVRYAFIDPAHNAGRHDLAQLAEDALS